MTRVLAVVALLATWEGTPLIAQNLQPIAVNDNRTPAGQLRDGLLTLRLEVRKSNWQPESDD
jgi:hypothetical protein